MWRPALFLFAALGGCKVVQSSGADAAIADAEVDARPDAAIVESRIPFTTVGTTPAGSLDDVRFLHVGFLNGFCQPGYYVNLYRTNELFDQAVVTVFIEIPARTTEPPTGSITASAWAEGDYAHPTNDVSFEIVQLDIPPTTTLRIAGRVLVSAGAWNMDFTIDWLTTAVTCI